MEGFSGLRRKSWSSLPAVFAALLSVLAGAAQSSGSGTPPAPVTEQTLLLTRAIQVHNLPSELTPKAKAHLIGTVTYYDPLDDVMFLQDASGGVFIGTDHPFPVHNGDLIEVEGGALPGYKTEVAPGASIRVLGRGPKPTPHPSDYAELATGNEDSQLVVLTGKVRTADVEQHENASYVHLDVGMDGEEVEVYLGSSAGFDPNSVIGATIEVTAVAGGVFDAKSQLTGIVLYAPDSSSIRRLGHAEKQVKELPLTEIDKVFEAQRVDDTSPRVRVRGTVTYYRKGDSIVLQRDGKSIYAQTRDTSDVAIGDVVDLYGIPSNREYAPSLRQAVIVKTGGFEQIDARPVSYADALSGIYSDNLISLTGVLQSQLHDASSDTLVLNIDGHLVNGSLMGSAPLLGTATAAGTTPIPNFDIGSRIRITGICRIVPGGPWRAPVLFHLEMRSAADAQLLSEPSWWSVRHLVELLSALLVLALSITVWAVLLRKRVNQQTERINRSMVVASERSKILERISSNQNLEAILSEICQSIMALLPGFICSFSLAYAEEADKAGSKPLETAVNKKYFEMALADDEGNAVGQIVVSGPRNLIDVDDQNEVYATFAELATLAVERSQLHQQLVRHSTHDPLTELPNRRLCEARLQSALDEATRHQFQFAVIYIDVNRFKHVNDRYGHKAGDLYLKQISARLQSHMRAGDTLARIGGDEFLVIAPVTTHSGAAPTLLRRLQGCFDEQFLLEDQRIEGSASFGLAIYPDDGTTAEELKRNADQAMYIAKRKAAGAPGPSQDISITTPDELELALKRDHFRLAYQPQFSADGRLTGLEALIRLEDPILGTLTPDAFISVAERNDVIIKIGEWVLRRAIQDAIRWGLHRGEPMVVVVNVSVRQLEQHSFADLVLACLRECNFPADRLELEITERTFISNGEEVVRQLQRLRELGIRISLDDFGTGQSSLSMLHKLPIDTIKLDRSFIGAVDEDPKVWPIIKAISFMAESLGKRIVAEGIEHVGPVPTLMKMGTTEFQGYLLSRPVPAEKLDDLIQQWRAGIEMPEAFRKVPIDRRLRLN
jgi:diguanylate cyclase (GGDEF)-like protein